MNGDIIAEVDMGQLYRFQKKESKMSMSLLKLNVEEEAKGYGQIEIAYDLSIKEFSDKN